MVHTSNSKASVKTGNSKVFVFERRWDESQRFKGVYRDDPKMAATEPIAWTRESPQEC